MTQLAGCGPKVTELVFIVPGQPVPKMRARVTSKGAFTPDATRDYETLVNETAIIAAMAWSKRFNGAQWPLDQLYVVRYQLYTLTNKRMDVDNVGKSILDGMNPKFVTKGPAKGTLVRSGLWNDDSQAIPVPLGFPLRDARNPRCEVIVEVRRPL